MSIVYLNHCWVAAEAATIPIHDRGFLYGDGLFTTIRVEEGNICLWPYHLARLQTQSLQLGITIPSIEESLLEELVQRNQAHTGIWRLKIIITRESSSALHLPKASYGTFLMTLAPVATPPPAMYKLAIYPHAISKAFSIKSLSYLDRLHVRQFAQELQCDDAITFSPEGFFLETAFANIFWRSEEALYTPAASLSLVEGVYLAFLKDQARQQGLVVEEVFWTRDTPEARELPLFCCNAIQGVVPATW
jgi:4-amino-4-deoxychorismate lyase